MALLLRGIAHLRTVREGLEQVLEAGRYQSVAEARGVLSHKNCAEPAAFERANYMRALTTFGQTATVE